MAQNRPPTSTAEEQPPPQKIILQYISSSRRTCPRDPRMEDFLSKKVQKTRHASKDGLITELTSTLHYGRIQSSAGPPSSSPTTPSSINPSSTLHSNKEVFLHELIFILSRGAPINTSTHHQAQRSRPSSEVQACMPNVHSNMQCLSVVRCDAMRCDAILCPLI